MTGLCMLKIKTDLDINPLLEFISRFSKIAGDNINVQTHVTIESVRK